MLIFVILTVFILSAHWESPRTQGAGEVKRELGPAGRVWVREPGSRAHGDGEDTEGTTETGDSQDDWVFP